MPESDAPPPVLEGGRLLAYAMVDESIVNTGRSTLYVDGKLLVSVPRLAICQVGGASNVLLLFCDESWNALGVVECASQEAAFERAESEYQGLRRKWIVASVSEDEAARYLDQQAGDLRCSFCGKAPNEVQQMFSSPTACICDNCVRDFSQDLNTDS